MTRNRRCTDKMETLLSSKYNYIGMTAQILIVGTSHISPESKEQVRRIILERSPECVCVELDRQRLAGLRSKTDSRPSARQLIRRVGFQGFLFAWLAGWAQKKLGDKIGAKPGEDMLVAVDAANQIGAKIALVDQNIDTTLRRLKLTWREKFRLVVDLIKGLFGFGTASSFDIRKVPDKSMINFLLDQTKDRYPTLYRVLVSERNEVMARRIARIATTCEGLMVVVIGAGHEDEVTALVQKYLSASNK